LIDNPICLKMTHFDILIRDPFESFVKVICCRFELRDPGSETKKCEFETPISCQY
jgi:hypothetical protein